jgi:hypothetical protein
MHVGRFYLVLAAGVMANADVVTTSNETALASWLHEQEETAKNVSELKQDHAPAKNVSELKQDHALEAWLHETEEKAKLVSELEEEQAVEGLLAEGAHTLDTTECTAGVGDCSTTHCCQVDAHVCYKKVRARCA